MKMKNATVGVSKRKYNCKSSVDEFLRERKGRLYIFRRCVVMLLCWHD